MKVQLLVLLLVLFTGFKQIKAIDYKSLDRKAFYNVLKSGTVDAINDEITAVESSNIKGKDAFEGTLLMKKAGLLKVPKQKLENFKKGRIKLETAIKNDSTNTEYRFMRLIIQEHAPKQAKYQAQLKTDADFITQYFKTLSPELQEIIIDYSKQSKTLSTASLR